MLQAAVVVWGWTLGIAALAAAQPATLSRAAHEESLRGMWLGQSIANWTGIVTEGRRNAPPFFTDSDWGTTPPGMPTINWVFQSPWGADDDTDIESVYLLLLEQHGATRLSAEQIREGWITHVNRFIWVSNARARALMGAGNLPPETSIFTTNTDALAIDAQLTTEFFGALAPGMPEQALAMAHLPIRTTASGHAAHAAEFFVLLHSYAPVAPAHLAGRERVLWLVDQARAHMPASSKVADIVDVVRTDVLANPDPGNWERTRDLIHQRYQASAASNGFVYRGWFESSVNFATGIMALLYGAGDYQRTVQIAVLSGWDSDNPAATMGGLVGLMLGEAGVRAQFPGQSLSGAYWLGRTRDAVPDRTPFDPASDDTFALMAQRMLPIVDRAVVEAGGSVDQGNDAWVLPPLPTGDRTLLSPASREAARSAVLAMRSAGTNPTPITNAGILAGPLASLCDGREAANSGTENTPQRVLLLPPSQGETFAGVLFPTPQLVEAVRLIEGAATDSGFASEWLAPRAQVRVQGVWTEVNATPARVPVLGLGGQIIDFPLPAPALVEGVRVIGAASPLLSVVEVDALLASSAACDSVDFNNDGIFPDDSDVIDFIFVLGGGACPACNDVDFNNDGVFPDDADLAAFLFVLGGGSC